MFQVTLDPEFSSWLEKLTPLDAEEVAAALDLVGEALSRRYYGDSVRRAEARWANYLSRLLENRREGHAS